MQPASMPYQKGSYVDMSPVAHSEFSATFNCLANELDAACFIADVLFVFSKCSFALVPCTASPLMLFLGAAQAEFDRMLDQRKASESELPHRAMQQ